MAAAVSAFREQLSRVAIPLLAAMYAVAVVVAPPRSPASPLTTYAGASTLAYAADLAAGLGLLAAGLVAWSEPRARRLGLLAILAGVAWFGPDWDGWVHGPALVRSVGAFATLVFTALVAHLVLAFPSGRLRARLDRVVVGSAYGVALFVGVGRALFRDPLLDPYCWRNCIDSSFLVHADPGIAGAIDDIWVRATLAIALLLVVAAGWRLAVANGPARRALSPALVPGVLVGAVGAAYAVALLRTPLEDPTSTEFSSIFLALSFSVVALAAGLAWSVVKARKTRAVVSQLATELGEAPLPGTLQATLAAAVGDSTLEVAYWLPGSTRFVDSDGTPTEPPGAGYGRAITSIVREGEPVAVVAYDAALLGGQGLEREIGSAARLAVENERLQAEILAQLEDLRASRARIVETGDAERRRLERDLHDGAQQRLLALFYDVRLARATAEADGDREIATLLASAEIETQAALGELRELAYGIYPAILAGAGLAPALATLADEAPLPVELSGVTPERFPVAVETAAYLTVARTIEDAASRRATSVSVGIEYDSGRLIVSATDDGTGRSSGLVDLADRVGALGGSLEVGRSTLRVEIPCV